MSKFDEELDEIVKDTGAGTDEFKKDIRKRLKIAWLVTLSGVIVAGGNFIAILSSWWPESDAFTSLVAYIFVLSFLVIMMGILSLLAVWFQGYGLNKAADYQKKDVE